MARKPSLINGEYQVSPVQTVRFLISEDAFAILFIYLFIYLFVLLLQTLYVINRTCQKK